MEAGHDAAALRSLKDAGLKVASFHDFGIIKFIIALIVICFAMWGLSKILKNIKEKQGKLNSRMQGQKLKSGTRTAENFSNAAKNLNN